MKIKHNGWESSVFRQIFIILKFHLDSTINPFVKFPLFPSLVPKIRSLKLFKTFLFIYLVSITQILLPTQIFCFPTEALLLTTTPIVATFSERYSVFAVKCKNCFIAQFLYERTGQFYACACDKKWILMCVRK